MAKTSGPTQWQDLGTAWNAVIEFSAALAVYGVGGYYADKWLHTGHVLFLGGLLLGMGLGLYIIVKRTDQAEREHLAARRADRAAG
ncbi:MAG: putative F0F1-ATPase subunit Ca2+/Mg2+ transporter [Frankiaceae bacterium]|jgi:F0F1-type ATP synthase assembly protein I|nr:putative F0F1-ATPase subunit Ca2+/Mg2+ transporter [Frankiaceae bacterium]